jgi:hypothetical protein
VSRPGNVGDTAEHHLWRTKQNLDFAWAMIYARARHPHSRYYLQLEDDVRTVEGVYAAGVAAFI